MGFEYEHLKSKAPSKIEGDYAFEREQLETPVNEGPLGFQNISLVPQGIHVPLRPVPVLAGFQGDAFQSNAFQMLQILYVHEESEFLFEHISEKAPTPEEGTFEFSRESLVNKTPANGSFLFKKV
jgi:hypothetical protein